MVAQLSDHLVTRLKYLKNAKSTQEYWILQINNI